MASIHRFFQATLAQTAAPVLTGREAHHAMDVLRLRTGDSLTVLDGAGHEFRCAVKSQCRDQVGLAVVEKKFTPAPLCPVTLLIGIPKGKMETIVEKATELGAARIVPLLTDRTVVQIAAAAAPGKVDKWRQVAIEAIKQCGSPWLPQIELPQTPAQFLGRGEPFDLPLVASLQPDSRHSRKLFSEFHATHRQLPRSVAVWVGPEGDFTPEEYIVIQRHGARPVTLGPLVLRADTAAICCLASVNYELQWAD